MMFVAGFLSGYIFGFLWYKHVLLPFERWLRNRRVAAQGERFMQYVKKHPEDFPPQ